MKNEKKIITEYIDSLELESVNLSKQLESVPIDFRALISPNDIVRHLKGINKIRLDLLKSVLKDIEEVSNESQ